MNFRTAGISDWRRLGAGRGEFSAALGSERGRVSAGRPGGVDGKWDCAGEIWRVWKCLPGGSGRLLRRFAEGEAVDELPGGGGQVGLAFHHEAHRAVKRFG